MINLDAVLSELRTLILDRYILLDRAPTIAAELDELTDLDDAGDTDTDATEEGVAERLTGILQEVSQDRHLRVRRRPDGAASFFDSDVHEQRYAREAVQNAGGIRKVERLDTGTALLEIAPYTSPVHLAAPYVFAGFALVHDVAHLVVDLRHGLGGTPETVALICGHLLGREPVHLQDVVSRDGAARQYWSSPMAHRLDDDARVSVLTSSRTFSGCEELAYNLQAQRRATVYGETTGGGAHPVEAFRLTDTLEATIPVAASRNAVIRTNWEQVGVVPDVACHAAEALERALAAPD